MDIFQFFFRLKWPDGFRCPKCNHRHACVIRTRNLPLYQCKACRHQTSLTAGTVLEGSRTPLHKWFAAIQAMARPGGVNAVQLTQLIGVTYKTAWSMLRKLRQAIHDKDAKILLSGTVETGVEFYGPPYYHPFKRYPKEIPVIVGIAYRGNRELGYLKIKPVDLRHMRDKHLLESGEADFLLRHVHESSRRRIASYLDTVGMPELKCLFRMAKYRLDRMFHGVSRKYLEYYFDEYCYRLSLIYRGLSPLEHLAKIAMRPERVWKGWQLRLAAA